MVKTVEDIKKAKDALFYPPKGNRSVGMARANSYLSNFSKYFKFSESIPLIIIIEHIDAVNNLDDLLKNNHIDCIMIGPYDLTGSMGIPGDFTNPKFLKIKQKIMTIAKQRKVPIGIHLIEPNLLELKNRVKENYNFIAYSLDVRILINALNEASKFVKKLNSKS